MKKGNLLGALCFFLLIAVCAGGYYLVSSWMNAKVTQAASDSRVNTHIRIGGDSYLGYFFMNSPQMKVQSSRRGFAVDFTNDGGDYNARLEKFNKGEYDAIVLPINSYLTHGKPFNYPGSIVAAIAESRGADAMACFTGPGSKLPADPKTQDLNDASLKIVYTSESPSSFLLDLLITNFDLFNLKKTDSWRVDKDGNKDITGSDQVLKMARKHQGDCFVMWEPDVQRALKELGDQGLKKVWGSDKFGGYIIDVFVFHKDFMYSHHDDLVAFLESYFTTMKFYDRDPDAWAKDINSVTGLPLDVVAKILKDKEIHWYDLKENAAREFGIAIGGNTSNVDEGVINAINSITDVLIRTKPGSKDPLDGDPYKIVKSDFLKTVQDKLPKELGSVTGPRAFAALADADWNPKNGKVNEVGLLRVEPITFQAGTANLSSAGEDQVDKIGELLKNNFSDDRVIIRGHTGKGSDEQANLDLSQDRAEAVMQRLTAVDGIAPERLRSEGMGSSQPPKRKPDCGPNDDPAKGACENQRQYMYRIPRVEFTLFEDASNF